MPIKVAVLEHIQTTRILICKKAGCFSKIMTDENCPFMFAFVYEAKESLVSLSYFWNNPK